MQNVSNITAYTIHACNTMEKVFTKSWGIGIPYSLDQTPRLLFISSRNFVRLLFESGYYLRAAFIKLSAVSGIGKIFCKCKGFEKSQLYKINKELRCGDLVLKQNFQLLDHGRRFPTKRYSNISRG